MLTLRFSDEHVLITSARLSEAWQEKWPHCKRSSELLNLHPSRSVPHELSFSTFQHHIWWWSDCHPEKWWENDGKMDETGENRPMKVWRIKSLSALATPEDVLSDTLWQSKFAFTLKLTRPSVNPCRAQQDASASTFCAFLRLFVLWNWEGYIEIIRIPRQLCFWSYSIGQGKLKHNSFSRLMFYVAYILHPCELHQNALLWGRAWTFFADPCFASLTPFRRNFQVSRPKGASGCDGVSALCCFLARNRAVYAAVW